MKPAHPTHATGRPSSRTAVIAVACALAVAPAALGCADPYTAPPKSAMPPPVAGEQPAPTITRAEPGPTRTFPSPQAAARHAAKLTGTWTGQTIADHYRQLAQQTTGPARRMAAQAAAQLPTDPQLTAPGARSHTTIQAITTHPRGTQRDLLLVVRERLHADGLTQDRLRVIKATAQRHRDGWALTQWQPQP